MGIYFLPLKPGSGEAGTYNRRPTAFVFRTRPFAWTWGYSDGAGKPTTFPPVRLLVDGVPATPFLEPGKNEYVFSLDLPDGRYVMSAEGAGFEVLPKPFVVNVSGNQLPDDYAYSTVTRFERSGTGVAAAPAGATIKVAYPGALPTPKTVPLKARKAEPFREVLPANKLWLRHGARHTHAGMTRRWARVIDGSPKGALIIENDQNYFLTDAVNKGLRPHLFTLRDGPVGVGSLGFLADVQASPVDAGWYWVDTLGRVGFVSHEGRVITIAGWRLKAGELRVSAATILSNTVTAADREFYERPWEMVGDWSQASEPHAFYEPWGIAGLGHGPTDGLHEFWITDTLNGKIRYVNHYTAHPSTHYHKPEYPPPGYVAPDAPTGQSQIADFETGLSEPWGIAITEIDGEKWLYWSEFAGYSIWRRRLDGSTPKELVLRSSISPTYAELGADPWPPYRLRTSRYTGAQLRAGDPATGRPPFLIDGAPGVSSCIHPMAIRFDSRGRLTWVEGYVEVVRRLEDGVVKTVATLPHGPVETAMTIDTEGTFGPIDDIFTIAWWQADARHSTDGVKRTGGVLPATQAALLLDGPAEWCRTPGYGWVIGIAHGRFVMQGNAGASQFAEYTKRLPTDPVIDVQRAYNFAVNWWKAGTLLELAHGQNGQGELGLPRIEEIATWTADAQRAFFRENGVPESELENALYFVWASTVNYQIEEAPPPPPPPPVDCVLSEWGAWSEWTASGNGQESRTRTRAVVTPPANGGGPCGPLIETDSREIPLPELFDFEHVLPRTVQFTSLGAGATAWAWDFGDGERSAEANPLHTYAADGEYSVSLVAGVAAAKPVVIETPPPVDCVLSDWSEWSDWTPVAGSPAREERTRTRSVVVEPANGGKACDPRSEREERDVVIPPPPPPSWIPAAGECKAIRQNAAGEPVKTLMQVGPYYPTNGAGVSYKGIVGTAAVVGAWGSATLCTGWGTRGALAACNGGDGDYWGNEVYVFDFDTRDWERISDPNILVAQSDPDYVAAKAANPSLHVVVFSRDLPVDDPRHWNPAECEHGPMVPGAYTRVPGSSPSQYLPSANPVGAGPLPLGTAPGSPHNYDGICYLPGSVFGNVRGAVIFPHLTYVYGTSSNSRAYAFDLDTRRWHRFTHNVSPGWAPGAGGRLQRCGVDLEAGRIYHSYGYTDLATRMQVSRQWAMNQSMPIESKMHFDTTRRIWIGANTTQGDGGKTEPGALIATSPDSGLGYVTLNMQGELWPRGYGKDAGLAYVPELDAYYLYNCLGSNDTIRPLVGADVLYKIQPPASDPLTAPWVVSIERMAGEIPERTPLTIGKTIGNMGRFCWNPAIKSLVTLNSASGFVYLYKPQGLQ